MSRYSADEMIEAYERGVTFGQANTPRNVDKKRRKPTTILSADGSVPVVERISNYPDTVSEDDWDEL